MGASKGKAWVFAPDSGDGVVAAYATFDRRTLGFTRILLGFLLLTDLFRRLPRWFDFYTAAGLFPRSIDFGAATPRTLFDLLSTRAELSAAFAVMLAVYLALFVGYHTRVAHALSFVLVTSLDARAVFLQNGGSWAFHLLVLWTLFLPMGDRFSVDALRASLRARRETAEAELNDRRELVPERARSAYVSLVGPIILLQLSAIYILNVLAKTGPQWQDLTAVRPVLYTDRIVTPLAAAVRDHLTLPVTKVMTAVVLAVERLIPVFLLSLLYRTACRRAAILCINAMHIGFGLMLHLGDFSWSLCVFSTLLFSREDWELAERTMRRPHRARTVSFDPASARSVAFCRLFARLDRFELLTFRADPALGARFAVEARGGARRGGARALSEIIAALPLGPVVAGLVRLPPLALAVDAWAARARDEAPVRAIAPTPTKSSPRAVDILVQVAALVVFCACVVNLTNDTPLLASHALPRPKVLRRITNDLQIREGWAMFAPDPPLGDGALVVDAVTAEGRHVDPFTGKPPNFDLTHAKGLGYTQFFGDYAKHVPQSSALQTGLAAWILRYPERTGRAGDAIVGGAVHWVYDHNPTGDTTESTELVDRTLFALSAAAPHPEAAEHAAEGPGAD